MIGVAFSVDGRYLYSAGSLGSIALYDASNARFQLLRLLGNTIVRGESHGPNALAVSPDGKCVAFVGPTEFTVTVVDGRTLDEVTCDFHRHVKLLYFYYYYFIIFRSVSKSPVCLVCLLT